MSLPAGLRAADERGLHPLPPAGRDEEAIAVLHNVARRNKTECHITAETLRDACIAAGVDPKQSAAGSTKDILRRSFENVNFSHITALFRGTRMAINSTIIILVRVGG